MTAAPWSQHGPDRWGRELPSGAIAASVSRAGEEWLLMLQGDFPVGLEWDTGQRGPIFSRHRSLDEARRAGDEWLEALEARWAAASKWTGPPPSEPTDAASAKGRGQPPFLWTPDHRSLPRRCSQCGAEGTVVVVGEPDDYESRTACLCRPCVEAALRLFDGGGA